MKVQVRVKNVYGNKLFYPVCEKAKQFAAMTEKVTLTSYVLSCIESLGFEIEVVQEQWKV